MIFIFSFAAEAPKEVKVETEAQNKQGEFTLREKKRQF